MISVGAATRHRRQKPNYATADGIKMEPFKCVGENRTGSLLEFYNV
jgi:hypothetical protein